jgi:hypothetical protein
VHSYATIKFIAGLLTINKNADVQLGAKKSNCA